MKFFKSAQIFDPSYIKSNPTAHPTLPKKQGNQDNIHVVKGKKWGEVSEGLPFATHANLSSEYASYCSWVKANYQIPTEEDSNPFDFWKYYGKNWPNLANVAFRTLSIPVSNAASERSFSKYNDVVSYKRTNLSNDSARVLAMMYFNGDVEKRFAGYE